MTDSTPPADLLIAVATKGDGAISLHFGQADIFEVYPFGAIEASIGDWFAAHGQGEAA